jgi:site-specific DNA-methyltransferase (adenine-specific)
MTTDGETIIDNVFNEDVLVGIGKIPDSYVDLIIADPPYGLGKDYGNDSDKMSAAEYLLWSEEWINAVLPKLKSTGSFYIFLTWRYAPEIFSFIKTKMIMLNEIIWDRRVPSMGGSIRSFSSVHDTIGLFVKAKKYYFDLDSVRVPYDEETKKARTRAVFAGSKWLEHGYNPKDLWSIARIHKQDPEREEHPTQKPLEVIDRMVLASSPEGGFVLDPFMGSGTTAVSCINNNRHFIGFELNSQYCKEIEKRINRLPHA